MGRTISLMIISGLVFFSAAGCDKIKSLLPGKPATTATTEIKPVQIKGTVIAKINNSIYITLEDLNKEIELYNASLDFAKISEEEKAKLKIISRDDKIRYLKENMVRQRVFYQAALDKRLDQREDIMEILEKDKIAILAAEVQRDLVKDIKATSAEIDDAYNRAKDLLKEPEERKVRELVTATESDAKQMYIQLLQGADFASLAKTNSIHSESAKNGGDLGLIKKGDKSKFMAFDEVVFSPALTQGAISNIFKGPDGYYIVKVEAVRGGTVPSIKEVWDKLDQLITMQKRSDQLDKSYADLEKTMRIEFIEREVK